MCIKENGCKLKFDRGAFMKQEVFKYKNMNYILSVPDDFKKDKKYPTIIFLHGAGGRGNNIDDLLFDNPFFELTGEYRKNAVAFVPQCFSDTWFDIFEQLQDFIDFVINTEFVNADKVYLMGGSMGGYTTWQMSMTMPEKLAAIVPICGGGMYWNAERLKNLPIWAFHGTEDDVVFFEESKKMVDAVKKYNPNVKFTVCKGVKHNSWINAFECREMFEWLFSQTRVGCTEGGGKAYNLKDFG